MNGHPKAIEARARAEQRTKERQAMKDVIKVHKLHFHVVGDYTFCYKKDRRNIIGLSSALRNPTDHHDLHVGRATAFARFMQGQIIVVRIPRYENWKPTPREFLTLTFTD